MRTPGASIATPEVLAQQVRDALENLYDLPYLQSHPLAAVAWRAVRVADEPGTALRRALLEAIEELVPGSAIVPTSHLARRYQVLKLRYLDWKSAHETQTELALSRSQYYRELQGAIEAVAVLLSHRWAVGEGYRELGGGSVGAELEPSAIGPPVRARHPPRPLTTFVGRDRELAEVASWLVDGERLVTIVGPPGVGKTRLALEASTILSERFADGVRFVSLAVVTDEDLALMLISHELGAQQRPEQSAADAVAEHLQNQRLVLVLDDLEQVVQLGPALLAILQTAPGVRVLATSRLPLRVRGEREFALEPLPLPSTSETNESPWGKDNPVVRLFTDRATAVRHSFALSRANAAVVAEICRRLDGLPLAVELAAARIKLLSPEAILARLHDRLALLVEGPRDLPERQRSLRAAIEWSYELLDASEQALFRLLAVFPCGAELAAVEAVWKQTPEPPVDAERHPEPLVLLEGLVESSLLRAEQQANIMRFTMLETIREYGLDRLAAAGETEAATQRHAAYFARFAESAASSPQKTMLERIEHDYENLRAAFQWFIEQEDADQALSLATAMTSFWYARSAFAEGRQWLVAALNLSSVSPQSLRRARALAALGRLARRAGDDEAAGPLVEQALGTYRELGDRAGEGDCLDQLGRLAFRARDAQTAKHLYRAAIDIAHELGDTAATAERTFLLAHVIAQSGDWSTAREMWRESSQLLKQGGRMGSYASALCFLAGSAVDAMEFVEARSLLKEAMDTYTEIAHQSGVAQVLDACAGLAAAQDDPKRAFALAGAADALREALGAPMPPPWEPDLARRLAPAREALSAEALQAAWAEGQQMGIDDAITFAREIESS